MSDDGRPEGTPDVAKLLRDIERSVEIDINAHKQVLTNHLHNSDQVIANVAAMAVARDNSLIELLKANPT